MNEGKPTIDIVVPLAGKGGVENVIRQTACYLLARDWQVRVVQMVYDGSPWLDENVPFYPLRREKVNDILEFIPMYAQFLRQTYVPELILATPWPYMALAVRKALEGLRTNGKVVAWLHGPVEMYKKYEVGGAECLGFADHIFVLNERTRTMLTKLLPQVPTTLVYNPVDFSKCREAVAEHNRCLLFVGRLSEEKGVSVILDAVAASDEWKLKVVGSGPQREALMQQAQALGITERVEFLGWQDNPWEQAKEADALVMASEYEAFPLAAIEAMACGLPVFSTPVDGIIELVRPGENGFLFEKGNSGELAQLLNLYAQGKLARVDAAVCKRSVEAYQAEAALEYFACQLEHMLDKTSVIVWCYNVAECLPDCLEHIFSQRMNVRLEVICVDDRSEDNTLKVLMEWEARYPEQLMVVALEEHCGRAEAERIALSYASGSEVSYVEAGTDVSGEKVGAEQVMEEICQ